jgi:ketosteroid isomerase-like protein
MKQISIFSLLISVGTICAAQSKQTLVEEARKAIEASNAIYSDLANRNDGSILTRYTEDACLLPSNTAPLCGREAVLNFFKDGPKVHSKFTIISVFGEGGDYVTEQSNYELYDMNWKKLDEGKILVVWKKTNEGWKMHRDMFSSNWTPSK